MKYKAIITKPFLKLTIFLAVLYFLSSTIVMADKKKNIEEKDCFYCQKYETLADWPVNDRPKNYIYEEIQYPDGMFMRSKNSSKLRQKVAGKKVYLRFVKAKSSLNKYKHHMIRDSAYFEAMFNEMLNNKSTKTEKIENLLKARNGLRQSLKISPNAKSSEAIYKFWATGKLMHQIYKLDKKRKKNNANKEIDQRIIVLQNLKKQIQITKMNAIRAATISAENATNK